MKKFLVLSLSLMLLCCWVAASAAPTAPAGKKDISVSNSNPAPVKITQTAPVKEHVLPTPTVARSSRQLVDKDANSSGIVPPADPNVILQGGDTFASATAIAALPYTDNGTTTGYTHDYTETCASSGAPDVVYVYTPTANGTINVSLCGSTFDTVLGIYLNNSSTQIGCNDDFCGLQSEVDGIPVTVGNSYYFVVDGYSSSNGNYTINVSGAPTAPPNDVCDNITPISLVAGVPQTVFGNTDGAIANDCASFPGYPLVWEAFTTTETLNLTLDMCGTASQYGLMYFYLTDACACNIFIANNSYNWTTCVDLNPTWTFNNIPAGTYYLPIIYAPANGNQGPYQLNIVGIAPVPLFPDVSVSLPGALPYTNVNTNCGLGDRQNATCLGSYDGGEDITYEITVTVPTTIDITLDPGVDDYTGMALSNTFPLGASCIAVATNAAASPYSIMGVSLAAGTYYLMIDTWPAPPCITSYTLSITEGVAAVPDFVITAPGTWNGNTCGAVNDCSFHSAEEQTYEVTIPTAGLWTFSLCNTAVSWDTWVYLGTTVCGGDLGYNDDYCGLLSQFTSSLTAGTYYFTVSGYTSSYCGEYQLDISMYVPCAITIPPGAVDETEVCGTSTNGGCNNVPPDPPTFEPLTCGETVHGTAWANSVTRDTDWYQLDLASDAYVTWGGEADFPLLLFILSGDCLNSVFGSTSSAPCTPTSVAVGLAAGTYYLWAGPSGWYDMECGGTGLYGNNYVVSVTCGAPPNPIFGVDPTAVVANAGPGGTATQILNVSNSGTGTLNFTVSAVQDPLLASFGNGQIVQASGIEVSGATFSPFAPAKLPGSNVPSIPDQRVILQGGDVMASATAIPGIPYSDAGTTVGYTNDYDAVCPYGPSSSPDVVYSYAPAANETINITMCASSYDTKLYIFENTVNNVIACNDDFCPNYASQLDGVALTAGNTYYIIVDGYGGESGAYVMDITVPPPPPDVECPPTAIPEGEPICADESVDNYNGGCNSVPQIFQDINAGDQICGQSGTFLYTGLNYRDTDWYRVVVADRSNLTWQAVAEFPVIIFVVNGGTENCADYSILGNIAVAPMVTASLSFTVDPGVYWVLVMPSGFTGVTCGAEYLAQLTVQPAWLSVDVAGGSVPEGGAPVPVTVTMEAGSMPDGDYTGSIVFNTDELGALVHTVGVVFTVGATGPNCHYTVGDVNNDGLSNGNDIVAMVQVMRGRYVAPYTCICPVGGTAWAVGMDVNNSCSFNGNDVTYYVRKIRGQVQLIPCAACPPVPAASSIPHTDTNSNGQ